MPIREALKRLDAEGLVVFINNRGAMVSKHSLEEIAEIFDVRTLLEVDLLRQAIPLMQDEHFAQCETLLEEMEASYAAGNVADWGPLNSSYHALLYRAANKTLTMQLLERVSALSHRYVAMHINKLKQSDNANQDHRALLELARQRDIDGAADLLHKHLQNTKQQILALITQTRAS